MAKRTLGRLLGRRAPPPPEVAAALERLNRLVEAYPSLREGVALQRAILHITTAEEPQVGALDLAPEHAAAKLQGGVPLLRNEHVPLDIPAIQALLLRLCAAIEEQQSGATTAGVIRAALGRRALDVGVLVREVLEGQVSAIRERAAALQIDGDMLCMLLRFSLFPALARLAGQLAPLRAQTRWQMGYCPTCGSWPLLGEYRGIEQTRMLRCGLCATEWAIDRLLCPFCGSRDHADLAYLHVEGQEQNRAATCEGCRGYVKMLATLTPIPPIELAVYDLATIHLDLIALERGYAAPA